jgi:hypothetical protein
MGQLQRVPATLRNIERFGQGQLRGGPSRFLQNLQRFATRQVTGGPSPLLQTMQRQAREDLLGRGALSPELSADVSRTTLGEAGRMGMGWTPGTLGTELLNRERYREGREQLARQYATGTEQLSEADLSRRYGIGAQQQQLKAADIAQRFGLATGAEQLSQAAQAQRFGLARGAQQAGIEDLASRLAAGQIGQGAQIQDIASRFGIGGQVQGLTQADIAQRYAIPLSVASSAVSNFGNLTNPILAYLGNLFSGNQQAATQAALGESQAGAANKSGQSGLIGSGIGAIGSIAGAVIL